MTRSVLITGGTGSLGAAVTNRFLEDGHSVVATSRRGGSPETAARSFDHFGERFRLLQSDVTDPNSVAELVNRTVARLGTIEVLIHLVGGWAGGQPLQDVSLETWERMLDINLRSAFLCSRAVLPMMRQQGWGRIVFVSSEAARSGRRHQGAYALAKAGVAVLAETIAEENNDLDVTANVVAPSALDTPANRAAAPAGPDHSSFVSVEDVAMMIAFLASVEAGQLRGAWLPAFGHA
jgi:NAD(P)-dependent dehydrogenase (short-subunit alcohol dehydrogenase family)